MNIILNNTKTEVPEGISTIAALADWKGVKPQGSAIARNGSVIRKTDWASTPLHESDTITVISATFGG